MQTQSDYSRSTGRTFSFSAAMRAYSPLLLAFSLIAAGSVAQAQQGAPIVWSGGSSVSSWTSGANWSAGAVPANSIAFGTGNKAVFSEANPRQMPNVTSNRSIYGILFTQTGYVISGGDNVLSVGGAGIEVAANVTAQINTALFGATQSFSVAENSTLITTRAINNNRAISKTGVGVWEIRNGIVSADDGIDITEGSIVFGADNRISSGTNVSLSSATFDLNGYSNASGTLLVNGNGLIDFGSTVATSSVVFADSSALDWSLGTLTIRNYKAGDTVLRFGVDAGGLTETQLGLITFEGFAGGARIDGSGYLAPIPESDTASLLIGAAAAGTIVMLRRRRKACR